MKDIVFRKWNSSPQYTENFSLITKKSDLGEALYEKAILGFYINGVNNTSTSGPDDVDINYTVKFWYRDDKEEWSFLGAIPQELFSVKGNYHYKTMLQTPIKVQDAQIRITGNPIRGDFRINDFGLIFRKTRTSSKTRLD